MGLKIGEEIRSYYYYGLSSIADLAYNIYDENGDLWAYGNMTELDNTGIYYKDWTPDAAGVWIYRITKDTVKDAFVYHIGLGQEADIESLHDVPAKDASTDAHIRDVVGKKDDTSVQDADATQKSVIALVKGLHDVLWDDAGVVAWPAGVAPGNGVSFAEAVRYVVENQIGSTFDGSPSLYTAIITGYTGAATSTPIGAMIERLQLLQEVLVNANTMFTSTAATVNTVTCASLVDRANLYEGMMLVPLNGNQAGQGRYITNYDGDDVLTVVPDWGTGPDAAGAFRFAVVPTPAKFNYEAGKGLSAIYDLVNGIPVLTRIYNDYDIQVLTAEETVFEYDDAAYIWHPEWLMYHLDEAEGGEQFEIKIYEKDNDTDDAWVMIYHGDTTGVVEVPGIYVQLPPVDLAFKVTVEQTGGTLRDVLFKLYKKS